MPVIIDGTNGVNTPNTFAFKNRLINAQLLINQRGVSGTVTLSAGAYGHDRFKAGASGCTYTFATTNNVTTLTITAGSLQQVIEGLNLESGTYTLSWTGTVQGKIGAGSYGASGITGSITGGTNTTIEFNTGTLSLPQLEVGSTATSFDYRPYTTELQLAQRYYFKKGPQASSDVRYGIGFSASGSSTTAYINITLPVNMRTGPTSVDWGNTLALWKGGTNFQVTGITITSSGSSVTDCLLNCTTSGITGEEAYQLVAWSSGGGFLALGAEL